MLLECQLGKLRVRENRRLTLVGSGGEVILTYGPIPRARLVRCEGAKHRVAGLHAGAFQPAPDFDEPLPDEYWVTGQPS
jgi:hypothetical protein